MTIHDIKPGYYFDRGRQADTGTDGGSVARCIARGGDGDGGRAPMTGRLVSKRRRYRQRWETKHEKRVRNRRIHRWSDVALLSLLRSIRHRAP